MNASLLSLLLLVPPPAPAIEDAAAVRLSLADALALARRNAPRLAQLEALRRSSEAGLRGARAARMPQLELSASYTRNSDVPELTLALPGQPPRTVFPNIPDNYRTRAGLSLPLYTGGRVEAGIDAAREQAGAAQRELQAGEQDLRLETISAYWSLVTARESARVLRDAVTAYEAHLKDAGHRAEVGMAARNEVLAVRLERDRAELSRLQSENGAGVAEANLRRLLGLSPAAHVEPVEDVTPPEAPAEDVAALVDAALAARPELVALRSREAAAGASARVARSATRPQASLQAGYDFANPNPRILPLAAQWKGTWSVGVALSLMAFDGGRASAAAAQAQAQADAIRSQREDLEARVRLDVTSRVLDVSTARAGVGLAQSALEAAQENLKVTQDRYREGLAPSSELLDAEAALWRAGLDQTATATQLRLAQAQLERAVGR
jgi:outer membrane protein TolC